MCAGNLIPRFRARKSRIRQRLGRYHYGRRPFRYTRSKALEFVTRLCSLCAAAWRPFGGLRTTQSRNPARFCRNTDFAS
jgi:hypothetical protein